MLADLERKALAVDPVTNAALVAKPAPVAGPGAGLLAPSIATLLADEYGGQLFVMGTFGEDPGADRAVTVGGASVVVTSWTPDLITVALPASGPGSAGDVVVTVRGIASNPRRLVSWRGTLVSTLDDEGSLTQRIELDVAVRLDPERIREQAGDAPVPNPLATSQYPGASQARWEAAGTHQSSDGVCTTTVSWSGSGSVAAGPPAADPLYSYSAVVDATARELRLTPSFHAGQAFTQTTRVACPEAETQTYTEVLPVEVPMELLDAADGASLLLSLDATLGAIADERTGTTGSRAGGGAATAVVSWDAIPAVPGVDGSLPL